jgi:uncharacterized membrane protein YeaQ/YmgE (transglycosylase-associated protein family)
MTIVMWVVLGLVVGFVASRLSGSVGYGLVGDIVCGGVGAVAGGWVGSILMWIDASGLSFDSSALAAFVAMASIGILSFALWRRRDDRGPKRMGTQ